ncbi:FMN-linked oxidoreductase [Exidia glandulosa HHB12029]|uniref:FMN-linked oxidoreductase n=1 Tax=Exidia glandulosa HHB12029 TaxID=1314781 RepID=A0A165BYD1_EXIGL|nr:FMN-linked oxidoreductase [Exidia glandulosa HHB12029]
MELRIPPHEMLARFEDVNIAAPMVRYSKLPFRELVSSYEAHITHTPMILAKEFSRSSSARASDFTTSKSERGIFTMRERRPARTGPIDLDLEANLAHDSVHSGVQVQGALVAQFAATDARTFADACELISPYVDGVDLNCGCPQSWAYQEHIGSYLLRQPETVRDIIRGAHDRCGWNFPVSIKIRVDDDTRCTQRLVETAIQAGASHISIHGRTRHQASTAPVSLSAISFAVSCAKGLVPTVANGDIFTLSDARSIRSETGVDGVMAARGLLANPALFADEGKNGTPDEAVKRFVKLGVGYGLQFGSIHRHVAFMLESRLTRPGMKYLNSLVSTPALLDFLAEIGILDGGPLL